MIGGWKKENWKNRALNSLSPSLLKTPQFLYSNSKYLRFYVLKEIAMSKIGYGLNLRLPSQQKKKQQQSSKPPRPPAFGFNDGDDDDVESDISRQASKNKSLKDIEEQQKKALEEDPTVFDYDGVYDDMKQKAIQPRVQDRQDRMVMKIQFDFYWKFAHNVIYTYCINKYRSDFL